MDNLRQSGGKGVRSILRSSKSVRAPGAPLFGAHSFNTLFDVTVKGLFRFPVIVCYCISKS